MDYKSGVDIEWNITVLRTKKILPLVPTGMELFTADSQDLA